MRCKPASTRRLRLLPLIPVVWILLAAVPASAQAIPTPKIAVLDYQRVLRESDAGKDIRRQIDAYRKSYQKEIKGEEQKLRMQEEELKRQRTVLAADLFTERRRKFEERVIALQRRVQDRTRALDRAYEAAMRKLRKPLLPLVRDVIKNKDYNVVVDNSRVLIVLKGLDITDTVIGELNKKVPKMKVPKPAVK